MFDKPIVIYSEYCEYSKNFLKLLMKYPDLFNSFIRMNIDVDINTKKRPRIFYEIQERLNIKISKVPTVITSNAEHILTDKNAFKWLEHQIKQLTISDELTPFNPNEMISFSDNYADYGSTNLCDAKEQSFKFLENFNGNIKLTNDNFLNTNITWNPNEAGKTNGFLNDLEKNSPNLDYAKKQNERQFFDNPRQQPPNQQFQVRNQNPPRTSNINFTDPNFGLSGKLNNNSKSSIKSKEINNKLEQLINDREKIDIELNQRPRFH